MLGQQVIEQECGQSGAAGDVELGENRIHVVAQDLPGDEECPGDDRGRQAAQEQLGDLAFPVRQAVQVDDE